MKRKIVNKLLAGCLIAVLVTPSEALAVMDGSEEQNVAVTEELTDDEEEIEASSGENNQEPEQNPENQETSEKETRTVQQESQSAWIKSGDRWWYKHTDGSYTTSDWELIDGKLYYFDADGWMLTGWLKVDGNWYYLSASGAMLTGWQKIGGKWYYLNTDGVMAADTWVGEYYVDADGVWIPGKTKEEEQDRWIKSGNRWWYRHADGSYTKLDWELINGKWYYFDANGWMVTGWQKVNGSWYYLSTSGAMLTGWQKVNGSWYYLAGSGAMLTGWQKINGEWYYLSASGAMLTGWQQISGKWYYLQSDGAMAADTWIDNYYVDASGAWVEGKTTEGGWVQTSDGRWYYDNGDGTRPKSTWKKIDGVEYYFDADGWMVTGWLKIGSTWYYLKSNGAKAYDYWVGVTGVGGYYIDKYGRMVAGTTYSYGNYIYTFDANGLCTGKEDRYLQVQDPKNGKTYTVEKQFATDPQVGVDVTEDEFLAAAVYAEAGNQGMPGMTGVALVMLNRMYSGLYPESANVMIYQKQQFEVARNGSLTKYLNNINSSTLDNAKEAVKRARSIMEAYQNSNTPRTVTGLNMPNGKTDFDYLGFMTPAAFESAGLDWEKTEAFTYLNTTFYTKWITK